MDLFLYDRDLRHERVNATPFVELSSNQGIPGLEALAGYMNVSVFHPSEVAQMGSRNFSSYCVCSLELVVSYP